MKTYEERVITRIAIFLSLLAIVLVCVLFWQCIFADGVIQDFLVTDVSWNKYITLERLQECIESGYNLPEGATLISREVEVGTTQVFDHEEYREVEILETYQSGSKDVSLYEFNPLTSEFEWVSEKKPEYSTSVKNETQKRIVFKNQNILKYVYYYKINRWISFGTYETHGAKTGYAFERLAEGEHDPAVPYWPTVEIDKNTQEASRSEDYFIGGVLYGSSTDETIVTSFNVPFEIWETINPGDRIKVLVQDNAIIKIVN